MKKVRWLSVLLVAGFLILSHQASCFSYEDFSFIDGFDSYERFETGTGGWGFEAIGKEALVELIKDTSVSKPASLHLKKVEKKGRCIAWKQLPFQTDLVSFSFSFRQAPVTGGTQYWQVRINGGVKNDAGCFLEFLGGTVNIKDSGKRKTIGHYEYDTWHQVRVEINIPRQEYSVFLDKAPTAVGTFPFANRTVSYLSQLSFGIIGSHTFKVWIDDVKFSTSPASEEDLQEAAKGELEVIDGVSVLKNTRIEAPRSIHTAGKGNAYTIYAETMPGKDWGEKINNALKAVNARYYAGEVVLPPGALYVSTTIDLAGGKERNAQPMGVVLRGAGGARGTQLIWAGEPNSPILDLPSPWFARVTDLEIDGNKVQGTIGVRFRAGWERGWNTARHLALERLYIHHCDVGLEIGDLYGPDLASHSFRDLWINWTRIAIRVMAANVANLWFSDITITNFEEAGFKLIGHSGRVVRSRQEKGIPTDENVLKTPDGEEVFLEDIPERLKNMPRLGVRNVRHPDVPDSGKRPWVGGGYPEVVVYGLSVHSRYRDSWVIDTNWAPIRIYTARMEGPAPILRYTSNISGIRNNCVFVDVSATSPGTEERENVIEFNGGGPLYLIGCSLNGNVALASTQCFSIGTHFMRKKCGFTKLHPSNKPVIHTSQPSTHLERKVPAGAAKIRVELEGMELQPDKQYSILPTPTWDCGGWWVSRQGYEGFTLNFKNAPKKGATIGILLVRQPGVKSETRYWTEEHDKIHRKRIKERELIFRK